MPLAAGARLGPFEILAPLGAGGMGEVYRARDTRLDRTVAVKILPVHLRDRPDLKERFEREARAVSSLNHPHICALYDIGSQDGLDFLVMEYLEGETLAARLEKGKLPSDQALRYAGEIAAALEEAHRRSVVHRDLKPGNIMLTRTGAKLLDFGLAKTAIFPADDTATLTKALTTEGTIVGTLQYMSPEQLEGKEADARSDIFAFGAVLYEMLTGRKAFAGNSHASVIAAILAAEPPALAHIDPASPPALDRIIRHALAKDPADRWQSVHDIRLQLQSLDAAPAPAAQPGGSFLPWIAAAVCLVLALASAAAWLLRSSPPQLPVQFQIQPPPNTLLADAQFAVSPDGLRIVMAANPAAGRTQLWMRSLDSADAQLLPGTQDASYPFWSADSRSIGFFASGLLKVMDVGSSSQPGPPLTLAQAPAGRGGTWNRDGVIVFTPSGGGNRILRISAAGGEPQAALRAGSGPGQTGVRRWPWFLPDGRHFLFLGAGGFGTYVAELGGVPGKAILQLRTNAIYASGHLLYVQEGSLLAQPFDADRGRLNGDPVTVATHVATNLAFLRVPISASETGVLAWQTGEIMPGVQLTWFGRDGKKEKSLTEPAEHRNVAISPDGRHAVVDMVEPQTANQDIWIVDLARGMRTRLTVDPAADRAPHWSPDGARVVFSSGRKGHQDLYVKSVIGARPEQELYASEEDKYPSSWSPDGRYIAYYLVTGGIWILPLEGGRKPYPLVSAGFNEIDPSFSPDGRWIAYVSTESGSPEVYVVPFPGGPQAGKWQVSNGGGTYPIWSRDGKQLFFRVDDSRLMAAAVSSRGSAFAVTGIRNVLEVPTQPPGTPYDVGPDGRFLFIAAERSTSPNPITVMLHWTSLLHKP